MHIHFVCSGNSFRSRLAEAYLKSLNIPNMVVSSSGSHTYLDKFHDITPYAAFLMEQERISQYSSPHKTQLNQQQLDSADIVVCMNRSVYEECLSQGMHMPDRTYVWDVQDVSLTNEELRQIHYRLVPKAVWERYDSIREHVNELVKFLNRRRPTEQIDILDEEGNKTGRTSDIATIHENGWWHLGVHIGLYTASGEVLLEKRADNIIFNAGLWDLSMGGLVKAGEIPEKAILRELREELGIKLAKKDLIQLSVEKYDHHLQHFGYHNRHFNYTFIAQIPHYKALKLQSSEVADVKFFKLQEVIDMNESKTSAYKIIPSYSYNKYIIEAIKARI